MTVIRKLSSDLIEIRGNEWVYIIYRHHHLTLNDMQLGVEKRKNDNASLTKRRTLCGTLKRLDTCH